MGKKEPPVTKHPLVWKETTAGRIYRLELKSGLSITVSRHRDYDPDVWLLHWNNGLVPLQSKDIEKAQEQAIGQVRTWLKAQLRDLEP